MPLTPTPDEIKKALEILLACPEITDKLLAAKNKVVDRRANWSRLSRQPYYNKRFALELKAVLDCIRVDGKTREYMYADYPGLSTRTVYLRVQQAKTFLLDEHDPDNIYRELFARITVTREPTGVRLTLLPEVKPAEPLKMEAKIVSLDEQRSRWKDKLDTYLMSAKVGDKPLHIKELTLTPDEVESLKNSFIDQDSVSAYISATEIKIVRVA